MAEEINKIIAEYMGWERKWNTHWSSDADGMAYKLGLFTESLDASCLVIDKLSKENDIFLKLFWDCDECLAAFHSVEDFLVDSSVGTVPSFVIAEVCAKVIKGIK